LSPRPFVYRKILGPWALYVELTATATAASDVSAVASPGARRITDHLWLTVLDKTALEEDVHHLEFGLRQVADAIAALQPEQSVIVQVERLTYPLTDYQPEAAAAAIAGWAAQEFGFTPPDIAVTFDRTHGYTLTWPSTT
jgi:hypothetical protein